MARGYDGTIRFDTSIDAKDFNSGLNKIGTAMKSILGNLSGSALKVAVVIGAIIVAVAAVVGAFVGATLAVLAFAQKFSEAFVKNARASSAYYEEIKAIKVAFDNLQGSVTALGGTILSVIGPVILTVLNWLIQLINAVNMFIAALHGQKQAMQYVAGSASQAAGSSKKAAKDAQGALAAFDQINVLAKKPEEDTSGGGSVNGGTGQYISVPIDPGIQGKIDEIKGWFKKAWEDIQTFFSPAFTWLNDNVIQPIWSKLQWLWTVISQDLWEKGLKPLFLAMITFWTTLFAPGFNAVFNLLGTVLKNVLVIATGIITGIIQIFGGLIQFLTGAFTQDWQLAWDGIKNIVAGIFNTMATVIGNTVNTIISVINFMISSVVTGINGVINALNAIHVTIPSWSPWHPGESFGFNLKTITAPQIPLLPLNVPKLATGAVIPSNAEFLAVLGDQKHGTNIEAPLDTITQAVMAALNEGGMNNNSFTIQNNVVLDGQVIFKSQKKYNRRHGTSLLSAGEA